MTVRELRKALKQMPPDAQVHVEVYGSINFLLGEVDESAYGHALSATRSEPRVVVISNRRRVPEGHELT